MHENLGAGHVSTNKELWFLGVKLTWEKDQSLFYFIKPAREARGPEGPAR